MELRPIDTYARAVRPHLPDAAFEPVPARLVWLPVHASLIGSLAWTIASGRLPTPLWPVASLAIGVAMALVAFLGHEVLHGSVVRGKAAIRLVGWICMLPFVVPPTLWTSWHNRVHHNHAMQPGVDPDLYPTLAEYQRDPFMRLMADYFGLGGRRLRSVISLLFGFTGQSQQMLWESKKHGILTAPRYRRALVELGLGVAFWLLVAWLVGG
ncbi:MAG: fatty acid desaturase, partial [Myxococcales bacterium]|nr:fatty acid desaturase [Myxococcales bacterium]